MKAITLHAPWATLLVTRQPCDGPFCINGTSCYPDPDTDAPIPTGPCSCREMVKRFETRSWPCPPSVIGQRVAFHAAQKKPEHLGAVGEWSIHSAFYVDGGPQLRRLGSVRDGELVPDRYERGLVVNLPLGAIVGSGVVTASLPITDVGLLNEWPRTDLVRISEVGNLRIWRCTQTDLGWEYHPGEGISVQLPYGDWTPGRYAWLIEDAAPTTERCPWCWGEGWIALDPDGGSRDGCPACTPSGGCGGAGRCDPIPATGRQGWWEWTP